MRAKERPGCSFDADAVRLRFALAVPGDVHAISPAVERVMTLLVQADCAAGSEFEIELALQEALANAIVHGCQEDPDKKVEVCVACDVERRAVIVLRDPGSGFDLEKLPSPVAEERILSDHGRGIFLINQLMDEVEFRRRGTEIWMRKGPVLK